MRGEKGTHVGIVSLFSRPQTDPGWTTKGGRHKMIGKVNALISYMLQNHRREIRRIHFQILVVGHNEEHIWLLRVFTMS